MMLEMIIQISSDNDDVFKPIKPQKRKEKKFIKLFQNCNYCMNNVLYNYTSF